MGISVAKVTSPEKESITMLHKKQLLSVCRNFGYVYSCSCGQYHIHLKGVTIYLKGDGEFCRFVEMLEEARNSDNFADIKKRRPEKRQLKLIKK